MKPNTNAFPELAPEYFRKLAEITDNGAPLHEIFAERESEHLPDQEALEDPIGEEPLSPIPNLIRKFRNRVLYLASSRCAVHCRFCFRRASGLFNEPDPTVGNLDAAIDWVGGHPEIEEVILSGGDPLMLDTKILGSMLAGFGDLANVKRLRIHTRRPVVDPVCGAQNLLQVAAGCKKPLSVVFHVAHPAELTVDLEKIAARLSRHGLDTQAQSVLLAGVNDDPRTLRKLFGGCSAMGLKPRYLHHPDRVSGAARFRLTLARGLALYGECEGYDGVPPYVIDLPDGSGKAPVVSLKVVGAKTDEGRLRRRYRWEKPHSWEGVRSSASFEWWDIAETHY